MKTIYGTILVSIIAAAMLLTVAPACGAVEKKEQNIWSEDDPKLTPWRWELTDEKIERIMNRLRQTKPQEAEELAKLRKKDPEKFEAELRKVMREQFGRKFRHQKGQKAGQRWQEHRIPPTRPDCPVEPLRFGRKHDRQSEPAGGRKREMVRDRLREKHTEYLEWLKKNYPEKAEKLAQLREEKPELYWRKIGLSLKKYGRIAEAAKENPELAEALKEDLELKEKRNKLLRKIRASTSDAEKKELTEELEEVINSRFDLIVKRKQIEYEQLSNKLEKLKERVKQSEGEVEKWKNVKKAEVKQRLEELISRTEKFNWE